MTRQNERPRSRCGIGAPTAQIGTSAWPPSRRSRAQVATRKTAASRGVDHSGRDADTSPLVPLLAQYDHATQRLIARLRGPTVDSGDGAEVEVPALADADVPLEPVPGAWSVRPQTDGPGPDATLLVGAAAWGRDVGRPHPYSPPITTIAWRMHHLSEMLLGRADWTIGAHTFTEAKMAVQGDAATALSTLEQAVAAWRAALDTIGHSTYPDGSDAAEPFLDIVW